MAFRVFKPFSKLSFNEWFPPILLLVIAVWMASVFLRREKRLLFLAGWIVLTLAPVLNIGSIGQNVFCERYLFIPSFGFCLLLAALAERIKKFWASKVGLAAGIVIVVLLGMLTINRNPVWHDDRILVQVTLGVSPDITKNYQDRGISFLQKGDLNAAMAEFEKALESEASIFIRSPENRYSSLIGISTVHLQAGRLQQAWDVGSEARTLNPERAEAYRLLGTVRSTQGKDAEAEDLLSRAVTLDPKDAIARVNLASVLLLRKKPADAERHFRLVLESQPQLISARLGLALCHSQLGQIAEAHNIIEDVLRLDPANADAKKILIQLDR
jgi:Flp pilus assembly protein TadD